MRDRKTGRFSKVVEEVNYGLELLLIFWRAIPFLILLFLIYKYMDLGNAVHKILLESICKDVNGFGK